MIFRPEQLKLMALGLPATPANIGGSDSNSQSSSTTNNIDQRMNADNGATATSLSGSSNNTILVNQTDHGAIGDAFGFGVNALDTALASNTITNQNALNGVVAMGTGAVSGVQSTAALAINGVLNDAAGSRAAYDNATKYVTNMAQSSTASVASAYQDLGSQLDQAFSSALGSVQGAYSSATAAQASAYQDAKTGNQRVLMIGALIVVALAVSMPYLAKEAK